MAIEFDKQIILSAISGYKALADRYRMDAAYGGSMHDNGAKAMNDKADAYVDGLNKHVPDWLEEYIDNNAIQEAKERFEYELLKTKFES